MHFQDIISTLNRFWADQECVLLQPYDTEKGAGTMSPHTVLRAIGPEPWAVAYPEPCRRPADGRYGSPGGLYERGLKQRAKREAAMARRKKEKDDSEMKNCTFGAPPPLDSVSAPPTVVG